MQYEWALALTPIFLTTLALRVMIARHPEATFDVSGHLYFAKELHEQRSGPFGEITLRVVGASGFSQPFTWHWIVSRFDPSRVRRYQAWANPTIDSIYAGLSYLLMLSAGFSNRVALFAVALYLLTPMWFSAVAIGPRIAAFTPRLSSEVVTNLFFAVTLLSNDIPAPAVLLCAVALASFVLSSSKFGVQALLFLTPLVSLLAQRWLPLAALCLAVAFTMIASRGRALVQLKSQVSHLSWYFRENLRGRMHVSHRNSLTSLFKRSEDSTRQYLAKLVQRLLSEHSYTAVIIKLPALLFVFLAGAASLWLQPTTDVSVLAAPVLAAVVVFALVNLRPLLFLGEAERYLSHAAFFIVLLAAEQAVANDLEWALWGLLAYGLVYWLLESFALQRLTPTHLKERKLEDELVLQDLQRLAAPTVVLCYPYHAGAGVYRIMSETPHRVVFCFGISAEFAARFHATYATDYPYVKLEKLDAMADEYGIGYVVIDRRSLAARGFAHWKPSVRWRARPAGGSVYNVYERVDDQALQPAATTAAQSPMPMQEPQRVAT